MVEGTAPRSRAARLSLRIIHPDPFDPHTHRRPRVLAFSPTFMHDLGYFAGVSKSNRAAWADGQTGEAAMDADGCGLVSTSLFGRTSVPGSSIGAARARLSVSAGAPGQSAVRRLNRMMDFVQTITLANADS